MRDRAPDLHVPAQCLGPAAVIDDFRPAVHDSDVLVIDNGAGERLWRPLANPARVQLSAFVDTARAASACCKPPTDFDRSSAMPRGPITAARRPWWSPWATGAQAR
jgi:hypothetical protein